MTLKGNLEVLNLSDIFQSLSLNQHTGTLRVTDGKREKLVHFAQGEITLLASEKKVKIGEMLVASGKISAEDLDYALQQQKKSKKRLGEILIEEGFVSEDDIAEIVKQQIEAEIYDLFLWKKADFEFLIDYIPEKLKNPSHGITRLQFNTSSLIMEALRRLDEWGIISKEISTLKEVYKVVKNDPAALEDIELPERVKAEIKLIDGEKTVESIAEETSLSEFELCKLLYELKSRGIVAPLTPQELSDRADESFQKGKFRQAGALYERLVEVLPKNLSIRWHLADSLKAFGDDARALEQYLFITQALEGTRDRIELAKAYRAVLELAPDRKDILEKLRSLDKQKWQRTAFRSFSLIIVVVAIGAAVLIYGGNIELVQTWVDKLKKVLPGDVGKSAAQIEEAEAGKLLVEHGNALSAGDYPRAFELGKRILVQYPSSGARKQVLLPITVRSIPPGRQVFIDDLERGVTDQTFTIAPKPDLAATYKLEIREGSRVRHTESFTIAKYIDREVDLHQAAVYQAETSGAIRGTPVFRNNAVYFTTLDGYLCGRALDDPTNSVLNVSLADNETSGYWVSDLVLADDVLYYGTLDGEMRAFNLATRTRTLAVRIGGTPLTGAAPIVAAPALTQGGRTLVTGGYDGLIYFMDLRLQQPERPITMANRITADLVEMGNMVLVAGRDNWLVALDAPTRSIVWSRPAKGDYVAPPKPVAGDMVIAGDATGEVVCLERRTGAETWPQAATLNATVMGIDANADECFVTTRDGFLTAITLTKGRVVWRQPTPPKPGRPLVVGDIVVVGGEGAFVAYDANAGTPIWTAKPRDPKKVARGSSGPGGATGASPGMAPGTDRPVSFRGRPAFYNGKIYIGAEDGVLYGFEPK